MRHLLPAACLGLLTLTDGAAAAEPAKARTSRHISDLIQAGFRRDTVLPPAPSPETRSEAEIILPTLKVTGGQRLTPRDVIVEKLPQPVLGTGVTEIKGRKVTFKLRRILFVPVAFKFEW